MFDVGFFELVIIALVALLVLGPDKLLHMAKVSGRMIGKLRHQYNTVKNEIEREIRVDEMRQHLAKEERALRESMQVDLNLNQVPTSPAPATEAASMAVTPDATADVPAIDKISGS